MKYISILLLTLFCLVVASPRIANAQSDVTAPAVKKRLPKVTDYRHWYIGLHGGLTEANTDIATSDFSQRKFGFGARVTRDFTHNFALQANFQTGKLSGENKDLAFTNDLKWEASLNIVLTIGNITFIDKTNRLNLYAFIGMGWLSYGEPKVTWKHVGDSVSTGPAQTVGVIPFGGGIKYLVSDRIFLHAEYSLHTTSDDGIDGRLVNLSENDYYTYVNLGVNYILGKKEKSVEWVNPLSTIYADLYDVKDRVDLMSGDKDGDGVADMFDKDPNTPAGTKVYGDGTAVDTDGDGVPDSMDADPFTVKGAKVDATGKENDADGDGVPDSRDLEPNTEKGMLIDIHGMGINGAAGKEGKAGAAGAANVYIPSVFFDLNSTAVSASYDKALASVALILKNNPGISLDIIGNCDVGGSEAYNQKLGNKRAESVKNALVKRFNVDSSRLHVTSKGKSDPLTKGRGDYHINRRVDFVVSK